jgi:hypothetical protein
VDWSLSGFAEFECLVWMVMSVLLPKSFSQLPFNISGYTQRASAPNACLDAKRLTGSKKTPVEREDVVLRALPPLLT